MAPPTHRSIAIANRYPKLRIDRRAIVRVIETLDAHRTDFDGGCPDGELSVVFLNDSALAKLHADFLDDPTTTDVITFEGDSTIGIAGEICVSADTAKAYAKTHGHDFSTELTLYVIHGWLHLAGYDDLQPVKKRMMRRAEARAMRLLQKSGVAIPKFRLA
jgi:probable rRNA maturation factor